MQCKLGTALDRAIASEIALRDGARGDPADRARSRRPRASVCQAGRAYVLQTTNVADTTLARLDAAEILKRMGREAEARREVEAFRRAWLQDELPGYLRRSLVATWPASQQCGLVNMPADMACALNASPEATNSFLGAMALIDAHSAIAGSVCPSFMSAAAGSFLNARRNSLSVDNRCSRNRCRCSTDPATCPRPSGRAGPSVFSG